MNSAHIKEQTMKQATGQVIWLSMLMFTALCLIQKPAAAAQPFPDALQNWTAKGGTAPAVPAKIKGQQALKLPCNFKDSKIPRAYWDKSVRMDLTTCHGIQFKIYCEDSSPVSGFTLYLHSGKGWYATAFDIETASEWNTVKISKADTKWEDSPGGFGNIDSIRLSAWRSGDQDTALYITDLKYMGTDGPIAIIRAESMAGNDPSQQSSAASFARTMADQLDHLGIAYGFMADNDITAERLSGRSLVILPYNPTLPDNARSHLVNYAKAGGKTMIFYLMPAGLETVMGLQKGVHTPQSYPGYFASIRPVGGNPLKLPAQTGQNSWNIMRTAPINGKGTVMAEWYDSNGKQTGLPAVIATENCVYMSHVLIDDDPVNKRDMLLAMIGRACPQAWSQSAGATLNETGQFGPYSSTEEAIAALEKAAKKQPLTGKLLNEALTFNNKARKNFDAGNFAECRSMSGLAKNKLIEAYCSTQSPLKNEYRAFWCHDAFGIAGMTWDQAIKQLADNGFTAIIPNMLWGGVAFYDSSVLPVSPEVTKRGDQVELCAKACKKYNIECHVWKVSWNMGWHVDKAFVDRMNREGRTQVSINGKAYERWLCPSHPANQKLEIDSMLELVRKYDITGIHFDYIRYPGADYCFCDGCRQRFETSLGRKTQNWPSEVKLDGKARREWLDFRRDNINTVVRTVSEQARKIKKDIKISAAVFSNWSTDRDGVGQDWKMWCDKGYLDFVCPMDYTTGNSNFENMVRRQEKWTGRVPCYPGIGLSTWSRSGDICRLIDQVLITREIDTGGFTIFQYGAAEAQNIVPLCGTGLTRK